MARFHIVGLYDCPWFAKADKLADEIIAHNSAIEIQREMLDQFHWNEFVKKTRRDRGWFIKRSPVIWEVLEELEGKGHLIGDIDDFCEFSAMYFDVYYSPTSAELQDLVHINKTLFHKGFEGQDRGNTSVFNIAIVNAPMEALELLLVQLLSPVSLIPGGFIVHIHIWNTKLDPRVIKGIMMEVMDLASSKLFKITEASSLEACFQHCHLFLLMEDFSILEGETNQAWMDRIEVEAAGIFDAFCSTTTNVQDCRILICGEGPQCYIAEMARRKIPYSRCDEGQLIALGQHILNKAKGELARIGDVLAGCIYNLHAWGWPGSSGAYVEVANAVLRGADICIQGPGVEVPLAEQAVNSQYIFTHFSEDFLTTQQCLLDSVVPKRKNHMCMVEATLATIHVWLLHDSLIVSPQDAPKYPYPFLRFPESETFPGLAVGIPCSDKSPFPRGTYMVQPSVCVDGKWRPIGKISEKTDANVRKFLANLYARRKRLLFRDADLDLDELIPSAEVPVQTIANKGQEFKDRPFEDTNYGDAMPEDEHLGESDGLMALDSFKEKNYLEGNSTDESQKILHEEIIEPLEEPKEEDEEVEFSKDDLIEVLEKTDES